MNALESFPLLPNDSESENGIHFYLICTCKKKKSPKSLLKHLFYFGVSLSASYPTYEIQTVCVKYKGTLTKSMVLYQCP